MEKEKDQKVIKWELARERDCAYKRHMLKNDLAGAHVGENTDEVCLSVWLWWCTEGPCLWGTRSDASLSAVVPQISWADNVRFHQPTEARILIFYRGPSYLHWLNSISGQKREVQREAGKERKPEREGHPSSANMHLYSSAPVILLQLPPVLT